MNPFMTYAPPDPEHFHRHPDHEQVLRDTVEALTKTTQVLERIRYNRAHPEIERIEGTIFAARFVIQRILADLKE